MAALAGKIAVVTGANRGIGKAIAGRFAREGARVVMAVREPRSAAAAAAEIAAAGGEPPVVLPCDVADGDSVDELARLLREAFPAGVHVLVNNAGILEDRGLSSLSIPIELFRRHLEVNLVGALRVSQVVVPLLQQAGWGRVINVSSTMGQFEGGLDGGYTGYRVSKAALNALTKTMAYDLKDEPIRVNAMHPGWVRTGIGGPHATGSAEEAAETALVLATLPSDGPTGTFWRSKRQIPW